MDDSTPDVPVPFSGSLYLMVSKSFDKLAIHHFLSLSIIH